MVGQGSSESSAQRDFADEAMQKESGPRGTVEVTAVTIAASLAPWFLFCFVKQLAVSMRVATASR